MVSVIIIWLYMTLTCYLTGFAVCRRLLSRGSYRIAGEGSYLYAGIVCVTVYAELYSLFGGVSLWAVLLLSAWCLLTMLLERKTLTEHIRHICLTITLQRAIVTILLFLLFAYGTSRGLIHYDTGLYHAQSIRWIEEYGVVPGLGNLHTRLAYNSAAFCLSALYSFAFVTGQSFHCCAGYLAFLLAVLCSDAFRRGREKKPLLSDLVRVLAVYYLLNIFDEMISPASDYFMVLSAFWLLITWFDLLEKKETEPMPYALLCILGVWICSVKFSGALLLLLTIWPAAVLIRQKRVREIITCLLSGMIVVLPFLIRNVILSGWLLYPVTAIDLFSFDFQIPKDVASYDAQEIQAYGRGYTSASLYDEGGYSSALSSWLPGWFADLDSVNQLFFIGAAVSLILLLILLFYAVIRKKKELYPTFFVMAVMAACFLFWFFSAPLVRYGCIFLWVFPTLVCGFCYQKLSPMLDRYKLLFIALALFGIYKAGAFGREIAASAGTEYLLTQKDYDNFDVVSYEVNGYLFYYPAEGDRVGYDAFPSAPTKLQETAAFRGIAIEEGFCAASDDDS